ASDVISAQSNRGNLFAGAAKCLVWNSAALFRCPQICPRRAHRGHACRNFQKSPPRNSTILFNVLWRHMPLLSSRRGLGEFSSSSFFLFRPVSLRLRGESSFQSSTL